MNWSLYKEGEFLKPLTFSNGKNQEDVVNEVLEAVKRGKNIIFIHGVCGTGKSGIALNIARSLGKTSIIVPGKNLQEQYKEDYTEKKYLLKEDKQKEKLKISIITGRNNHKCQFLEDNKNAIPVIKKEINSKLHDIFAGKNDELKKIIGEDMSADNYNLPCKIEIKEKNWNKIKEYLKKNKNVDYTDFNEIKDVTRASVAGVCPYWSPVLPEMYELKSFSDLKKRKYMGLKNTNFIFHQGKDGCKFYEQFNSYFNSDVIVFNSLKYKLESALNRKPLTEVEIIDECDEFLDSFANQRMLNLDWLQNSLVHLITSNEKTQEVIKEMLEITKQLKRDDKINDALRSGEIIQIKSTGIYDLLKILLNNNQFFEEFDEENYLFDAIETAKMFDGFFDETYITVSRREENLMFSIVTTNLAKKFKEMVEKNKILVLMSGTLHSKEVLKNIFGLSDYELIEAETSQQGQITIKRTGLEMDCKYSNFSNGAFTRKDYLKAFDKCVEVAKKPALIHINAYTDLPTEEEIADYNLHNLISREELRESQKEDKTGIKVREFKNKEIDVFFSTRCARGIDFPGEECNSIVFTKYPNPNVQDAFWKILMRTQPSHYWDFYKDKALRELWQKIYRGLRFTEDHVYVLSPDSRVLEQFEKK